MDPVTIATTATTLLLPYIKKGGEKFVETLGEKLPEGIANTWRAITARFRGKPAAEEAAKDLVTKPSDPDIQGAFRNQLRKILEADPGLLTELAGLLKQAGGSADIITNTGSGAVATHNGVAAGEGGVAVKGDVHGGVNVDPPQKR